jgi:phospholipase/carboxylesterase
VTALDGHVHVHVPASAGVTTTVVLLHGTGGDERQLLDLGRLLAPGAGRLGVRGNVLEGGATTRWFRRLGVGVFDEADLVARADALGAFLDAAVAAYHLDPTGLVAVGFSNGANIGAALALRRPDLLRGAVLFSAMRPFTPPSPPDLTHLGALLVQGRVDPHAPPEEAEALARLLADAGAAVEVVWHDDGHALGPAQVTAGRAWMSRHLAGTAADPGRSPA